MLTMQLLQHRPIIMAQCLAAKTFRKKFFVTDKCSVVAALSNCWMYKYCKLSLTRNSACQCNGGVKILLMKGLLLYV